MRTLEEKLAYLQQFGKPTLGMYGRGDSGWHASCSLFVPHVGTTVEVKSDYTGHDTPMDAVDLCIQRLDAMRTGVRP